MKKDVPVSNLQATSTQTSLLDITRLLQDTSGNLLSKLLAMERVDTFIQNLQPNDFWGIIKRIGEEDSLPLLAAATTDQWQHLLDLEIWHKDRLDSKKVMVWLDRLNRADASKLADWIYSEQSDLIALTILQKAELIFREEGSQWDVPPGYFTLDGSFYIKAFDDNDAPILENILRTLVNNDFEAYQALLSTLPCYILAETEEELYRLRKNRLAEYGFPSCEEALAVYSPLEPAALSFQTKPLLPGALVIPTGKSLVPSLAFGSVEDFRFVMEALNRISDPLTADRIPLDFTTLCNTLIAADSFSCIDECEHLRRIGRQAAGYIHVALTGLCNRDTEQAANLLQSHSLMTIFRVGFGFAIKLQWRVKHFISQGWFSKIGKNLDFWGSPWADKMEGLLFTRPLYFDCSARVEQYRHFERFEDLQEIDALLNKLDALDHVLGRMTKVESPSIVVSHKVFHTLLFNRWAHHILDLAPSFEPLSLSQARKFFRLLREDESSRPYKMTRYRDVFIREFLEGLDDFETKAKVSLGEALGEIWDKFSREYENIEVKDLDARYSKHLLIE